jgi:hypothetical protein
MQHRTNEVRNGRRRGSVVATLYSLVASYPGTRLDLRSAVGVATAIVTIYFRCTSPSLVVDVWGSVDAGCVRTLALLVGHGK